MLNIAVVPLVLDAQCIVQWRLLWELSLCVKVASSRSGLLATALVSKAALLSRLSRSHTWQARHALSLWRRKKSRKQNLRHIEFSRQATLKKWLLPFFLNAPPLPYNCSTLRPHVLVRPPFPRSRTLSERCRRYRGDVMISKTAGGAHAAVRKTLKKFEFTDKISKVRF